MTNTERNDLAIAHATPLKPMAEIADMMGLESEEIELYGAKKAKIRLGAIERLKDRPNAKYIVVTAITPTPLGEGKTTTSVGLAQVMYHIGKTSVVALRQPSLGPVFGIKGGGSGGGHSQVVPMEDMNLHLTGDLHAVAAAHNTGAAFLDNVLLRGNDLDIDPATIRWPRVMDVNDRVLR